MQKLDNNSALRNLAALVDFSNLVNSTLDINFALNNILLTCLGKFHTSKGLIALLDDDLFFRVKAHKGIQKEVLDNFPIVNLENYSSDQNLRNFIEKNNFEVLQPIKSPEGIRGLMLLGKRLINKTYDEEDLSFLNTILNVGATAIENSLIVEKLKKTNRELDSKINQLSSLFEISKEFSGILQPNAIGKLLAFTLMGQFFITKYGIVVSDKDKFSFLENSFDESKLKYALKECDVNKFTKPVSSEEISITYKNLFDLGVELIIPMQIKTETKGLILLGKRGNKLPFSKSDIEFIYSLGSMAIISIENARLFEEMLEKQRMERDLETARNIQKNLLPKSIPKLSNLELSAYNVSAKIVGGDYYDLIKLDNENLLIAIADVSGKGVPAALLMANLQAFLKSICKQKLPLTEATNLINDLIVENTTMGSFITFFWCIFNNTTKRLTYVNAGHNPPLLIRNGNIHKLKKGGMIIGFLPSNNSYVSETIQLQKDDVVVLFTDGITEAMNKNLEEFTDERLEKLVLRNTGYEPDSILKKIKDSIEEFIDGAEQSDDITCIVMKVK